MDKLVTSRLAWLLLAISALGLELSALYFQYAMQLDPCVFCVYERNAVALIFLAGIVGLVNPNNFILRITGYLLWASGTVWGLYLTIKHSAIQMRLIEGSSSCDFVANYPAWIQLDKWIPWLFNPTGFCEDIQWQFLGLSMPQSMVVINIFYLIAFVLVIKLEYSKRNYQ